MATSSTSVSTSRTSRRWISLVARRESVIWRLMIVGGIALVGIAHTYLALFNWYCPVVLISHHPCPTCGITRAARFLFVGDVAGAIHIHPLSVLVLPFAAIVGALEMGTFVQRGKLGTWISRKPIAGVALALAVALFVVWIARFFGAFGGPVPV